MRVGTIVKKLTTKIEYKRINRGSIKEAVDTLPIAACYFSERGMVKLCNLQMEKLYRCIAQTDLQYFDEFKAALEACDERTGVIRMRDNPTLFIFPDGKVWHYTEKKLCLNNGKCYTEALFINVTTHYEKSLELKAQTVHLGKIAENLKTLSDNVLLLTKETEVLAAKTRLHDQMGAGLIAMRQSILNKGHPEEAEAAIQLFRRAVSKIKNDNNYLLERGDWAECMQDAETIGIKMQLNGKLPDDENIFRIFMIAIRECLTNAARHAGAKQLDITIREEESSILLYITNDGKCPDGKITPKGGLLNLSKHVIANGGKLVIRSTPYFSLSVNMPYGRKRT